jgi:hypothetical protein
VNANGDGLEARFDAWVRDAAREGRVWILVDDDDLHMFFLSESDAAGRAQGTAPAELGLDELSPLFGQIEERGEALALWEGDSWIVAEPGVLETALREVDL